MMSPLDGVKKKAIERCDPSTGSSGVFPQLMAWLALETPVAIRWLRPR
jgi:hypothetical protein